MPALRGLSKASEAPTKRLAAFGGCRPSVRGDLPREDLSGDAAVAALAALLRSIGFEKVTVVFEQPPAT